jgi:hypothetical protein
MNAIAMQDDRDLAARISEPASILKFLLAGNAYCTFRSERTGVHLTFNVKLAEPRPGDTREPPHFVRVLTGPSNGDDYTYLGCIFGKRVYSHGRNSPIGTDATSAKAFAWLWKYLSAGKMPPECEVWHEGRCSLCGRRLTTPRSLEIGIGPTCEKKAG